MKTFNDYKTVRESSAFDIGTNSIGKTSLSNSEEGAVSALFDIIKIAWEKHYSVTKSFLGNLASKDPEIADKFNKLQDLGSAALSATRRINKRMEPDEVVPPMADGN